MSTAAPLPAHRLFSPARVGAIARNTLTELTRQKVFYLLLLFGLLLIGSSVLLVRFSFQDQFQMLKDISLGAMSIFGSLLAILATAAMLPRDIEERTLYTILAKPVPRVEYVLGKFLGIAGMLACALFLMGLLFLLILFVRERGVEAEMAASLSGDAAALAAQIETLRAQVFHPNLLAAGLTIFAKTCVLAALTLFVSTFATSQIFTVFIVTTAYFIGHFQATAREYWQAMGGAAWSKAFAGFVAILFPDLQIFNLVDEIAVGVAVPLALLGKTLVLGGFYVLIYLLAAQLVFAQKEL
ncbi:MAG: ABC transporter permease subunit [Verrucomicrobia bacterium]|nr:ABC transporter permease subunit [Verrucomicrobiota bacterium]